MNTVCVESTAQSTITSKAARTRADAAVEGGVVLLHLPELGLVRVAHHVADDRVDRAQGLEDEWVDE